MVQIKKVALAGGSGNLGPAIVEQIIKAGFELTVLTRSAGRPDSISEAAHVKQVDYDSHDSLVAALKGQDAFVSNVGSMALGNQPAYIDAAIDAGVPFFIPSEFGCDTTEPKAQRFPVFKAKIDTQKYLAEKAKEGKISYALILSGAFLDWGLQMRFLANVKDGDKLQLYDGGDQKFSASLLSDVGRGVAGVLKNPDEFKNRAVYVESIQVSQNDLIAAAKKAKSGWSTTIEAKDTAEVERQSWHALQTGGDIGSAMIGFLFRAIFHNEGGLFEKNDNKATGVSSLDQQGLEKLVANYV